ncbi:hypothetical protein HUJ04_006752 [Dendroctonus ponderosae]|uniref:Folylpolyglutamate synthase n=2 Tax=Dendroctonus ponderosae TaxID=77166 RepID=A0AAR5Q3G5_DENPD|nr:hypothetical protein HUJ04_006752 [Dendroctonus ponderosae]
MLGHGWCNFSINYRKVSQLVKSGSIMASNYEKAVETLNKLQSNAEYIKQAKIRNNPQNNLLEMEKFLNRSGLYFDQLDKLPVIHITGTNGKGTTCSYCENILRNHGYKTGFFSSPHLIEVRERIRLNGIPISQDDFAKHFWRIYNQLDKVKSASYDMPLYFRFLTLMALHIFLSAQVDVAILEVGIGGEYDCTNIVRKTLVAGITPLDIDHTLLLGNSIESIAWNKAGIMKPNAEVFCVQQPEAAMKVLKDRSKERKCNFHVVEDHYTYNKVSRIPLHVLRTNASLSLSISEAFMKLRPNHNKFNLEMAKQSIEHTQWPGRYEIIPRNNSVFYLDGAHTEDSMQVCSDWFLSKTGQDNRKRVLIFNVIGQRDPEKLLIILLKCDFDIAIFTTNNFDDDYLKNAVNKNTSDNKDVINPAPYHKERCSENAKVWQYLNSSATVHMFESFPQAVKFLENHTDTQFNVLVTGSIHLLGAALFVLDRTLKGLL